MCAAPVAMIDDDGRFALDSRCEVLYLLRQMLHRGEFFTVYFNRGRDFILTSLLEVDDERDCLIFDVGADAATNQRILQAERLLFVAAPDGILVQFALNAPRRIQYGEHDALEAELPASVIKLQRREFFRVECPLRDPLQLVMPETPVGRLTLPIRNLGVGGAGLEWGATAPPVSQYERFFGCYFDVRDAGRLVTDVQVRHVTSVARGEHSRWMLGIQFVTLMRQDQARLQRFLVYLERERRQLSL